MMKNWMSFALDVARLSSETQAVIGLRTLKLARGGACESRGETHGG